MFIVQCCQNNRIVGYSAITAQQASTTSSSAQVTTGQNTDVGTPPTALEEEEKWKNNMIQNSEVRIRKSVKVDHETTNIVCFQMNDSLHGSLQNKVTVWVQAHLLASLMMAMEILIFFPRKMRMRTKISSSSVPIIPTQQQQEHTI